MEVQLVCENRKFTFSGEPDDKYFKVWRNLGFYGGERDVVPYRLSLKPDSTVVDVGGNIGLTAVLTGALAPNGRGYFFEPDPKNYRHLKRTIEANKFSHLTAFPFAMGAEDGELLLNMASASSHADNVNSPNAVRVRMRSLDSWAAEHHLEKLDFLKIDVEGYELNVLRGAVETIKRHRPVALIEFNSLTTIMVGRILPYELLDCVMALFPIVHVVDLYTGLPRRLGRREAEKHAFVGENMTQGFVHDLLCCFEEGQINAA